MQVVYEDNHIIIVAKRSGEIVQGDKTGDTPLSDVVKEYLKEKYQKPGNVFLGVTHRLDRPVSGLVVFARTSKALARLNRMFAEGQVHKTYWAIVKSGKWKVESGKEKGEVESGKGKVESGKWKVESGKGSADHSSFLIPHSSFLIPHSSFTELTHWLTRNEQQNKSYAYDHEVPHSKKAQLRYRSIAQGDRYQLLEVELLTGRHHQIRCQLAAIGLPIKGDLKYGAPRSNPDGSISLLSRRVQFVHPVSGVTIDVEAPLPDDPLWQKLLDSQ